MVTWCMVTTCGYDSAGPVPVLTPLPLPPICRRLSLSVSGTGFVRLIGVAVCRHRPGGRVVMQRIANPCTSVRFRPGPPPRPVNGLATWSACSTAKGCGQGSGMTVRPGCDGVDVRHRECRGRARLTIYSRRIALVGDALIRSSSVVEQVAVNHPVGGSNPSSGANKESRSVWAGFFVGDWRGLQATATVPRIAALIVDTSKLINQSVRLPRYNERA